MPRVDRVAVAVAVAVAAVMGAAEATDSLRETVCLPYLLANAPARRAQREPSMIFWCAQ